MVPGCPCGDEGQSVVFTEAETKPFFAIVRRREVQVHSMIDRLRVPRWKCAGPGPDKGGAKDLLRQ